MIELINVTKSFEDSVLFDNYNLSIDDGEFVVIVGASGSGKSTLLNMIGGIEAPNSGSILVDGIDITQNKNKMEYFRSTVGFLFQNFALINNKTVMQNLDIVRKDCRNDVSADDILQKLGLYEKKDTNVYKLSGGEQQRVALARLMLKKCSVILADEPTGSLDSKNAQIVVDILKELNQSGKTVIMVTHAEDLTKLGTKIISI